MKKYVIEKYSAEIPAKDFKYEKGMLLNIEKDNIFEEIKSFDNKDLALNELKNYKKEETEIPKEDIELVEKRNIARKNKNWEESDRIRDILMSKGYTVKDGKEGTLIEK